MNIFSSLHGNEVNQFWILAFLTFRLDPCINALQSTITLGPKFKGQLLMHSIENKVSTSKIHEKLTAVHKMRLPRYGSTLRQHQEHLVLYIHNKVSSSGKKKKIQFQFICLINPLLHKNFLFYSAVQSSKHQERVSVSKTLCLLIWGSDLMRGLKSGLF